MNGVNQRPPAERSPGPFEGPTSYPQLCWWSLIIKQLVIGVFFTGVKLSNGAGEVSFTPVKDIVIEMEP
jgi:hypothetical protein